MLHRRVAVDDESLWRGSRCCLIFSNIACNDKDGQVFMAIYYLAIIAQDWWLIERLIESAGKKH